jgi:hypothetical protein
MSALFLAARPTMTIPQRALAVDNDLPGPASRNGIALSRRLITAYTRP